MTRQEFIRICGLFGISIPLQGMVSSCLKTEDLGTPFSGDVLIIGAGAGGLSAGYFLHQQGTRFRILEASSAYGGRMRINTDFSDFPIPLGAEWIETKTSVLQEMVNNPSVQVRVQTFPDHSDSKFLNYSWFNFYEDYIVPSIADKISFNTIVQAIDYNGDQVMVMTNKGEMIADKVILSVPLQVLKDGDVQFSPPLPMSKQNAIRDTVVWEGFKAFFEFRTNFYGNEEYIFPIKPASLGQKIYYNASKGQNTNKHILGLFTVGSPAQDYISRSGDDLKNFILDELDSIYAKQASPNYIQHLSQNWNHEPFIKGGYLTDYADWRKVRELGKPVANKIYFAGGEYTDGEDWVSIHTAAEAAKRVLREMNR